MVSSELKVVRLLIVIRIVNFAASFDSFFFIYIYVYNFEHLFDVSRAISISISISLGSKQDFLEIEAGKFGLFDTSLGESSNISDIILIRFILQSRERGRSEF